MKQTLIQRPDFYSLSECRDLCFHVQEKRFTIPELAEVFDDLDLDFLGFHFSNPKISMLYAQSFSNDPAMTNLDNWNTLEHKEPLLFHGMYEFWCSHKGAFDPQTQSLHALGPEGFFKN